MFLVRFVSVGLNRLVICFAIMLSWGLSAYAWQGTDYIAGGETSVYARASEKSKIIHTLSLGDKVLVGPKVKNIFRVVKYQQGSKTRQGFILKRGIAGWETTTVAVDQRKRWAVYFSVVESYQRQGKRDLQTTSDSIYRVSEFSGLSTFFAAGADMPYGKEWAVRLGLVMRKSYMVGESQPDNSTMTSKYALTQSFIGATAGLRYRPKAWGAWSFMGGAEFSKGTSVDFEVLNGPNVDDSDVKLPYFMIFSGALLYEMKISKDLAFEPGFRLGVVATAEPVIFIAEGLATIQYLF